MPPALSIRQPWAWLIVHGYKPIENRDWPTRYRGPLLIHAGKQLAPPEHWEWARRICAQLGITLPDASEMQRSGIVGQVELIDCVEHHASPWFSGPYGFVLDAPQALPFRRCAGKLGLFRPSVQ